MQEAMKMKKVLVFFLGQGSTVDLPAFNALAQTEADREIVVLLSYACEMEVTDPPTQIAGRTVTTIRNGRFSQDPNADYLMVTGDLAFRRLVAMMNSYEERGRFSGSSIPSRAASLRAGGLTGDPDKDVP